MSNTVQKNTCHKNIFAYFSQNTALESCGRGVCRHGCFTRQQGRTKSIEGLLLPPRRFHMIDTASDLHCVHMASATFMEGIMSCFGLRLTVFLKVFNPFVSLMIVIFTLISVISQWKCAAVLNLKRGETTVKQAYDRRLTGHRSTWRASIKQYLLNYTDVGSHTWSSVRSSVFGGWPILGIKGPVCKI